MWTSAFSECHKKGYHKNVCRTRRNKTQEEAERKKDAEKAYIELGKAKEKELLEGKSAMMIVGGLAPRAPYAAPRAPPSYQT